MFAGLLAGIGFGLKGMGYTEEDLEDLTEGAAIPAYSQKA